MTHRQIFLDEGAEAVFELQAGAVEAAAHGAHGDGEDGGDLLIAQTVELLEHDDRAMVGREGVQGVLDQAVALGAFERGGGIGLLRVVGGVDRPAVPAPGA